MALAGIRTGGAFDGLSLVRVAAVDLDLGPVLPELEQGLPVGLREDGLEWKYALFIRLWFRFLGSERICFAYKICN